jgi:hypothetical protein
MVGIQRIKREQFVENLLAGPCGTEVALRVMLLRRLTVWGRDTY